MLRISGYYFTLHGDQFTFHHEDDVHYYAKIAENLAAGHPFTFDRINPTNGFHPLWLLCSTAIFIIQRDPESYIRLYFVCQYLLFLGCVACVFFILLRTTGGRRLLSATLAAYFGLDDFFYKTIINGLETPLFVLLCLVILLIIASATPDMLLRKRRPMWMGLLMSALILSRLDGGGLHAIGFCVAWLMVCRKQIGRTHILHAALAAATPVVLFLIMSALYNGSPTPVSGAIKRATERPSSSPWYFAMLDFPNLYNWRTYYPIRFAEVLPIHELTSEWGVNIPSYYVPRPGLLLFGAVVSGIVGVVFLMLRQLSRRDEPEGLTALTWFMITSVGLLVFNKATYRFGIIPYWYPVTFSVAQLLMVGYVLSKLRWVKGGTAISVASMVFLVPFFYEFNLVHRDREKFLASRTGSIHWYDAAKWISTHTASEDVIASFNAGTIGFYSERRVINLDGLVNSHAFRLNVFNLKFKDVDRYKTRLIHYLKENNVSYFADFVPNKDDTYWQTLFTSTGAIMKLTEVYRTPDSYSDRAAVYQIEYLPSPAATATP
ncbi:MAG: hypothetical protein AABZ08_13540 [Planctomycetota bacterium]